MLSPNLASILRWLYIAASFYQFLSILSKLVTVLQVLKRRVFGRIRLSDYLEYTSLTVFILITLNCLR